MTAESEEKRTQAFMIRCYRRLLTLNISQKDHQKIKAATDSGKETEAIVVRLHSFSKDDSTGQSERKKKKR